MPPKKQTKRPDDLPVRATAFFRKPKTERDFSTTSPFPFLDYSSLDLLEPWEKQQKKGWYKTGKEPKQATIMALTSLE